MYAELVTLGTGEPIPLMKKQIRIGRRESCDVVLTDRKISGHHCLLSFDHPQNAWSIRDLRSRYGTRVGTKRLMVGVITHLAPNTVISIAKQDFLFRYNSTDPDTL